MTVQGVVYSLLVQHFTLKALFETVIKAIVAAATGTHLDLFQRIVVSPCSITAILYSPEGPVVLTVNSTGDDLTALAPS